MSFKTTKLREAITFALAIGSTAVAGAAFAQQPTVPTDDDATTLDRVEVTGSRIRSVDVETAQPVTFITRDDIEKQGFQSVADILQNIAATGTPPLSRASPLSAGEAAGGSYISLRNLGAARNLVLLNGRRLPVTTSGLADISRIPAAAVERIEVLKDGASSIYGSDAISGVVNIITRSNFEGASVSGYYGQFGEGDGAITRYEGVMGLNGERGSLTIAAEYREEDVVHASDRPYSAFPRGDQHPFDGWTTAGQYGGFVTTAPTATSPGFMVPGIPAGTRVVLIPGADPRLPTSYRRQNTDSTSPLDKSNTNEQTDLRTPVESRSLYVDGILDLTDNVRFRTNMLYNNRVSERTVAGYPMQAGQFATSNNGQGVAISPTSYFNPFPGVAIGNWWRRTWEAPRVSADDATDYIFSGAFEGSFDFVDRTLDWDAGYVYNQSKRIQDSYGNLNLANVRAAVGPSFRDPVTGQVRCGTAAAPIAACVPWNPLLPFGATGQGALTGNDALMNYLFQNEHATGEVETKIMFANISGTIFELPAGDLGFAFGLENRKEDGLFVPDALAQTGGSTNLAAGPTGGGYSVDEAFLELEIPLLSDLPFAHELSVNLASRFSDYDTFGETTNNKFSLKWKPFESLLLRATASDGFRAPTIADLYGGGSQTFVSFTDPCETRAGLNGQSQPGTVVRTNCTNGVGGNGALGALAANYRQIGQGFQPITTAPSQTPVAFVTGSNPTLTPELSKSQTIGAVWSPDFIEGLNVALDWWKIRIADTIVADSPGAILNDCYVLGIASRCSPALFTRDAGLGFPTMQYGNRNAGFRKVEGYDFDVSYRWRTEEFGNFGISSTSTYTAKDFFANTNDPQYVTSGVSYGSQFRVRSNLNLTWDKGIFGASWMFRYYSAMKENCTYAAECNEIRFAPNGRFNPDGSPASSQYFYNRTGSNTFSDVQVRVEAPWNATVALGANNVFEKVGPTLYSQPSANTSYYGGFDIGRFLYMRYTQRF